MSVWSRLTGRERKGLRFGPRFVDGQYVSYMLARPGAPRRFYQLVARGAFSVGATLRCVVREEGGPMAVLTLIVDLENAAGSVGVVEATYGTGSWAKEDLLAQIKVIESLLLARSLGALRRPPKPTLRDTPVGPLELVDVEDTWTNLSITQRHEMCADIPITALARTRRDDEEGALVVTSFGCYDPKTSWEDARFGNIDLQSPIPCEYGRFRITHPGSWALIPVNPDCEPPWEAQLQCGVGGNTARLTLDVQLSVAPAEELRDELRSLRTGFKEPLTGESSELLLRSFDKVGAVGLGARRELRSADGDRYALLRAYVKVTKVHAQHRELSRELSFLVRSCLESFEFLSDAGSRR